MCTEEALFWNAVDTLVPLLPNWQLVISFGLAQEEVSDVYDLYDLVNITIVIIV